MREFFKPWRRKAGCVTLVMACVLMAAWIRGLFFLDFTIVGGVPDAKSEFTLGSSEEGIEWCRTTFLDSVSINHVSINWHSIAHSMNLRTPREVRYPGYRMIRRWRILGFIVDEGDSVDCRIRDWVIPYWSIVLPLTLLSAWLLFSKQPAIMPRVEPAKDQT